MKKITAKTPIKLWPIDESETFTQLADIVEEAFEETECHADMPDEPLCGNRMCDNHGCIIDKLRRARALATIALVKVHTEQRAASQRSETKETR